MKYTTSIAAVIITAGLVAIPVVWGDSDFRWGEREKYERKFTGIAPAIDPTYKEECGSCHMAYAPGLLPGKSWIKIMSGLEDHFGDNAELGAETQKSITDYLVANSADRSDYRRARNFNQSIQAADTPLRISDTPYFRREHDEIPDRMVAGNPKVKSFSNCNACHTKAEQGAFNEHDIRIPGYGRWDD